MAVCLQNYHASFSFSFYMKKASLSKYTDDFLIKQRQQQWVEQLALDGRRYVLCIDIDSIPNFI